jgi:hypothetical protein
MLELILILKEHRYLFSGGALIASFLICYSLGVSNGRVPHVIECSDELIKQARLAKERDDLLKKIAVCSVETASEKALEVSSDCDKRVKQALEEARTWACED